MSGANVKAIESLGELRGALLRFQSEAHRSLDGMRVEARRSLEWLQSRQQYWYKELGYRMQALSKAQKALDDCQRASAHASNSKSGGGYDCSPQAVAVQGAKRAVQEAENELKTVQHFIKLVGEAYEKFQREGRRLASTLNTEIVQGTSLLERSSTTLFSYANSGFVGASGSGVSGSTSAVPSSVSAVQANATGAFSISDWSGYPSSLPRPQGPLRVLPKHDYEIAFKQGRAGARIYRAAQGTAATGKDAHHIQPIKFGGHPTDPSNLILLTRQEHSLYTVWWSRVQAKIEAAGGIQ